MLSDIIWMVNRLFFHRRCGFVFSKMIAGVVLHKGVVFMLICAYICVGKM